jgi:hypothetical protein
MVFLWFLEQTAIISFRNFDRLVLTLEVEICQFHFEICGGQSGNKAVFFEVIPLSPINTISRMFYPHLRLHAALLQQDKRVQRGNFQVLQFSYENWKHWKEKYFHFFVPQKPYAENIDCPIFLCNCPNHNPMLLSPSSQER